MDTWWGVPIYYSLHAVQMKRLNSILLWAGLAFLAYLIYTTGPRELWRQLALLGWGLLPFVLGEGIAEMIHTIGWRRCLSEPYRSVSWWNLFRIRMSGYAINYLTPSASIGGEVTKIALLAEHHRGPNAAGGVLIEKVSFALAQVLFVAIGAILVVRYAALPPTVWALMLCGSAPVIGGIIAFLVLQRRGKLGGLVRWLESRRTGSQALRTLSINITAVDDALRIFYRDRRPDLWSAIAWHVAGCSIGILQTWWFLHLLHDDKSLLISATAWTLAMWFDLLTFVVPLNVGSLEGSRILTLRAVGCSSLAGLTYGVAVRLSQLAWSGIGLLLYGSLLLPDKHAIAPALPGDEQPNLQGRDSGAAHSRQIELTREQSNVVPV